jgi:hypothetical protein
VNEHNTWTNVQHRSLLELYWHREVWAQTLVYFIEKDEKVLSYITISLGGKFVDGISGCEIFKVYRMMSIGHF